MENIIYREQIFSSELLCNNAQYGVQIIEDISNKLQTSYCALLLDNALEFNFENVRKNFGLFQCTLVNFRRKL